MQDGRPLLLLLRAMLTMQSLGGTLTSWPPSPWKATPVTALDELLPTADFAERHRRDVLGSPAHAYAATLAFSLAEMPVARVLFKLRGLVGAGAGLVADDRKPLLAQMTTHGFSVLADVPGREFVAGAIGQPWQLRGGRLMPVAGAASFVEFDEPGFVKMAMNFTMEDRGPRTRVTTETRVLATDAGSRRSFALYWMPVRIGSGLIRQAMLRAIARRTAQASATRPEGRRSA